MSPADDAPVPTVPSGGQPVNLPSGWARASLSEVTANVPNTRPQDEPAREFGYVDISSICNRTFRILQCKRFIGAQAPSRARRPVQVGDVLFSNVRTSLRNVALLTPDVDAQLCSTGFTVLRSNGAVDPHYLFRYVLSDAFVEALTPQQTGTEYPATSDAVVLAQTIPIPPLAEQHRIVNRVEALLTRLNASRDRLQTASGFLTRFRQAVLAAACSGRLTAGWREENTASDPGTQLLGRILAARRELWDAAPRGRTHRGEYHQPTPLGTNPPADLPPTWTWATVEQLTVLVTKGTSPVWQGYTYQDAGITLLRSQNVRWGNLDLADLVYLPEEFNETHATSVVREGDVLLNLVGASVGRSAVASHQVHGANTNQAVAVIRLVPDGMLSRFLMYCFLSPYGQAHITNTKADVARANFNLDDVKPTPVPLPPLAEQHEIVTRLDTLFALADTVDQHITAAGEHADRLTRAILAKAFRGDLVPQDPQDEPASALLARTRSQPASVLSAPKHAEPRERTVMRRPSPESLKEAMTGMVDDEFDFAQLREQIAGPYDALKDAVFSLLSQEQPVIRQVFNEAHQAIRFVRLRR